MKVNDGKIKMGKWFKHETFDYKPRNVNNTKLEHNYHGTVSRTHARTYGTYALANKEKKNLTKKLTRPLTSTGHSLAPCDI